LSPEKAARHAHRSCVATEGSTAQGNQQETYPTAQRRAVPRSRVLITSAEMKKPEWR